MIKSFSVPRIRVPTEFQVLDGATSDDRCNLAGCENYRVSARSLEVISNPGPELLRDLWAAQDSSLREQLGHLHGVPSGQVFLTSGAIAGIRYAFEVFVAAGTVVGLLVPDFPGFRFFADHGRARVTHLHRLAFPFRFTPGEIVNFCRGGVEFLIVSNPSAVTGVLWEPTEIEEMVGACPQTLFVIDEADAIYPELSAAFLVNRYPNVVFLQSFSKFYGLSGLRIGYLVAPVEYAEDFDRTVNPAELTSLSILAARAALSDTDFQRSTQRAVADNLADLRAAVAGSPLRLVEESHCFAAYLWTEEPQPDPQAVLEAHGIDIVPAAMFGLDRGGRVNVSNPAGVTTLTGTIASGVFGAPV